MIVHSATCPSILRSPQSGRTSHTDISRPRSVTTNIRIPSNQRPYDTWKWTCVLSASRVHTHGVEHPNSDDVLFISVRLKWRQRGNVRVHDHAAFGKEVPRYPGRTHVPSCRLRSPLPLRFEIQHAKHV